jgi:hypothetical protein
VIHVQSLAIEQDQKTAIAKAAALRCQLAQSHADARIIWPAAKIPHRRSIYPNHPARPALAHLERLSEVSRGFSPCGGRYHFFEAISFSIALSSIESANSFFSRRFSSSNDRSRRASETSRPPNLDFHL